MTPKRLTLALTVLLFSLVANASDSRVSPRRNPQAGRTLYNQNCAVCHGSSGKGDGVAAAGLNPKPANFADPTRQTAMTEAKQIQIVTAGGPSEKLSPIMPGFGEALTEQQIRDVVAFIRDTFLAKGIGQK